MAKALKYIGDKRVLLAIGILPFAYWVVYYINKDVWWDEVGSLKFYGLVSFEKTLTTYLPNNHIFFNLITNAFSKILGDKTLNQALDHIYLYRSIQLVISVFIFFYTYKITKKFFTSKHAYLAVILLASSIPFLNFSLQLRGYNLSMLLVLMVIYYSWSYLKSLRLKHLVLSGLSIFLLWYTIPSNLYFIIAFGLTLIAEGFWLSYRSKKDLHTNTSSGKRSYLRLLIGGFIALGLGLLAYLNVLDSIFNNPVTRLKLSDPFWVLHHTFPKVVWRFFSERWLLAALIFLGLLLWFKKRPPLLGKIKLLSLLFCLLAPFLFVLIHAKLPFERTFILLAPLFAIISSVFVVYWVENGRVKAFQKQIYLLLTLYVSANSFYQLHKIDKNLSANLKLEIRDQNLSQNFYLHSAFTPHKVAKTLVTTKEDNSYVMLADELDHPSLMNYLQKYKVKSYALFRIRPEEKPDTLKNLIAYKVKLRIADQPEGKHIYQEHSYQLPPNDPLNNYRVLLDVNKKLNRQAKKTIVITAYPAKFERAIESLSNARYTKIDSSNFTHIYELEGASKDL